MRFLQGFNPHPVAVRVFILNNCLPVCACLCRLHGRQAFFAQMVVSGNKQRGTGYRVQGSRIKGKPENKSAFFSLNFRPFAFAGLPHQVGSSGV